MSRSPLPGPPRSWVSTQTVRRLIRSGRLRARRVGGDFRSRFQRPLAALSRSTTPRAGEAAAARSPLKVRVGLTQRSRLGCANDRGGRQRRTLGVPACGRGREAGGRFCPGCGLDYWRLAAGGTIEAAGGASRESQFGSGQAAGAIRVAAPTPTPLQARPAAAPGPAPAMGAAIASWVTAEPIPDPGRERDRHDAFSRSSCPLAVSGRHPRRRSRRGARSRFQAARRTHAAARDPATNGTRSSPPEPIRVGTSGTVHFVRVGAGYGLRPPSRPGRGPSPSLRRFLPSSPRRIKPTPCVILMTTFAPRKKICSEPTAKKLDASQTDLVGKVQGFLSQAHEAILANDSGTRAQPRLEGGGPLGRTRQVALAVKRSG